MGIRLTSPTLVTPRLCAPKLVGAPDVPVEDFATSTVTVDGAWFLTLPIDYFLGVAGSTMRGALLLVGDGSFVWWSHAADTPSGVTATGYNPGDFPTVFPETVGRTGYEVELPAGTSTPEEHATLLAAVLESIDGIASATPAIAANDDGGWSITVQHVEGLTIAPGSRAWGSRGAAGTHGGNTWRLSTTGDGVTASSTNVAASIASAVTTPAADVIPWGSQILIGTTTSTASSARPRLQVRLDATADGDPAGSSIIFDAGQVPASQISAGAPATIFHTPAQTLALYTSLAGVGAGRLWLTAKATGGCHYIPFPTGFAPYVGQQVVQNLRTAADNDPTVTGPTTWTSNGSFGVYAGLRLLIEATPATSGERRVRLGSVVDAATHPNQFALPDSITAQNTIIGGTEGMRVRRLAVGVVSGTVRLALGTGGDTTPAVSADGVTVLWDAGTTTGTGEVEIIAPTGAATVRIPGTGLWFCFKGSSATGRGESGVSPFVMSRPDRPCTWIEHTGASVGLGLRERDLAATGLGNAAVPYPSPMTGTETIPDNCPFGIIEMYVPALAVA